MAEEKLITEPWQMAFSCYTGNDLNIVAGLSKREYFANSAPNVPDWFVHQFDKAPVKPLGFKDKFGMHSTHSQKELIYKYFDNENYVWYDSNIVPQELKDEVKEFTDNSSRNYNEWIEDYSIWQINNNIARFFQWRTFYADELIKQLNK